MMHRSKKLLGSGDEEYFNKKRPVNVRVDATAHLAESSGARGIQSPRMAVRRRIPNFKHPLAFV
ncbi:MAG TPA: hypothetical protein VOA64_04945 [Candidatus Dormibacteraeota bacterium]|nr:hypothetical protein [Candidatus Dormibacteraeota bacterium]